MDQMTLLNRILGAFLSNKFRWLTFGVVIVGGLLRLWVSLQPIDALIEKNLPDDSYYYFVIANNTIQSNSVSMDGINVTNGFHPLWLIVIMPIFGWSSSLSDSQITQALILSSVLDMVTIWIIGYLAAYLTRRESLGVFAAGLYAFNPIVILQVTNGLETAISMLTIALFLLLMKAWLTRHPSWLLTILVGVSGGLMFLARSDNVFLLGLAYLAALVYWKNQRARWPSVIAAGCVSFILALPWFLWSYFVVGSWMQESGVAVPYAIQARVILNEGPGMWTALKESLRQLTFVPIWLRGDYTGLPFFLGVVLWLIVIIGLIRLWRKNSPSLEKAMLLPLLGSCLCLVLVHAGVRWYPRPWYFIPSSIAFALAFPLVIKPVRSHGTQRLFLYAIGFGVYFALTGYTFWQIGYYPWQREMLAASRWLGKNISTDSKVASFNSGIYTYYNVFPVINLDGVVNHHAFQAIQDRDVMGYLQRDGVEYLIDYDNAINNEYELFMGDGYPEDLEEIGVINDVPVSGLGLIRVYRVLD
ncbi:MAG: hypothetical protein E3J69_05895 [Anaerolineales bacterium]|nr:MAG: hypothetical protein E3J69_05895 [Anaerolineales bacterium]